MEKRLYLLIALLAFLTLPAGAQVIILNDNILQTRMCEIRATVLDSLTNEPVSFAAAVVSDVGNPIVIKQDTVEFSASSFRVGSNAMLKDLIERMPGMEITDGGKVKFNGEAIDKLTVGGRTFFFKDQSTALNNLPAAVVDKIRVIDRESEQTRSSGVQDGQR